MAEATATPPPRPTPTGADAPLVDLFAPVTSRAGLLEVNEGEALHYEDWRELRAPLKALGRQACLVIALRAAKRVEVLVRLRNAAVEAAAAGLDVPHWAWYGRTASGAEGAASEAVLAATVARAASCAVNACTSLTDAADGPPGAVRHLVSLDVYRIQKITALEQAGRLPLTGWDDPRLGPLWPDGPPEWHTRADQLLRALQAKLANRPDPFAPPISEETRRQLADYRKICELAEHGAFDDLHGQYILVYNGQFVGHGPDLEDARQEAAEKCGVSVSQLAFRYIY